MGALCSTVGREWAVNVPSFLQAVLFIFLCVLSPSLEWAELFCDLGLNENRSDANSTNPPFTILFMLSQLQPVVVEALILIAQLQVVLPCSIHL